MIKGRYRKCAKEYPYRCIDDIVKKRTDVNIVGGKEIGRRRYLTLMRGQDRFLAEMAVNAGQYLRNCGILQFYFIFHHIL